jgi:hypothetical protein
MTSLDHAWDRLGAVTRLSFRARSQSKSPSGWDGDGEGRVEVARNAEVLIYREEGYWVQSGGPRLRFTNTYRWTLDATTGVIRLDHLRFGPRQPVYLFDLVSVGDQALESACPHVCRNDLYAARLSLEANTLRLDWSVRGLGKFEDIEYVYT